MNLAFLLFLTIFAPLQIPRLSENIASANIVRRQNPVYPEPARASKVEGVVILEAEINSEGAVTNVRVVSGHPLLTRAASDAVVQWRFNPSILNNQPRAIATVRVNVAQERGQVNCGPFPYVPVHRTAAEGEEVGRLACGEPLLILSRTFSHVQVETPGAVRGWIRVDHVSDSAAPAGSANNEKAAAAIGEAHLDCAQRPTLNIFNVPGATTIGRLACGESVSILQKDDPYVLIRTQIGVEGWVVAESLTIH